MIQGVVDANLEITVPLRLRGSSGIEIDVTAILDTGFRGELTLPSTLATYLSLTPSAAANIRLGDGSSHQVQRYVVEVLWNGSWRTVIALATGIEVLLGTEMLTGYRLQVDFTPGGAVTIGPIA